MEGRGLYCRKAGEGRGLLKICQCHVCWYHAGMDTVLVQVKVSLDLQRLKCTWPFEEDGGWDADISMQSVVGLA